MWEIPVKDYLKNPTYPNIIKLVNDGTTDYNEEGGERTSADWDNIRTQTEFEMDAPSLSWKPDRIYEQTDTKIQNLLFNFWAKHGPTIEPKSMKLLGYDMDKYDERSVVWDNLQEYYGDEELNNIVQERLEGLHDSWSYEYIVTSFEPIEEGDGEIIVNILVNGDTQIPISQESGGGSIDMSLWEINEKAQNQTLDNYSDDNIETLEETYEEVRSTISNDIQEVLLKDLPIDMNLDYLDISEPGTFEDYVKFNKVEKAVITEDDGYINDMVYRDQPRKKHIRRMSRDMGSLSGFPIKEFMNMPPPENESEDTEGEIVYLETLPVDEKLVQSADEIEQHFSQFLNSKGLEYPKEELKSVMRGVSAIILKLKYHYNRPRPFQIAQAKGLELNSETLESSSSPSYPSGHATQGRFIGKFLSHMYPQYTEELMKIGDEIAYSRNMAKVHYPSDSTFGKLLGDEMYDYVYQPQPELEMELDEYCPMGRPNKCEVVNYDKLPDTIHEYVDKNLDKKLKLNKGGEFNEEDNKECTKGMYYCSEDEICKPDSQKLKEQYELQTPTDRKKIELTSYLFPVLDDNYVITPHPRGEINYDGTQMAIFSYDEDRFIMVEDLYNAIEGMIQKGLPQEETEIIIEVMTDWINSRMTIKPELYEQITIQKVVRRTINEMVEPDDRKVPGRYYEWVPITPNKNKRVSTHVV